ncbi:MAG: glycoside hydrolase family 31 protein, partial [Bacteroidota bacterium]|nr:glycoside hydrolase family 31 protein [Bacteroidota bacterium]
MKKLIGCVAMFATCFSLVAQSFQQTAQGLTFKTQGVDVTLQCYAPDIIRVIKSPEGVTYDKPCLSVVKRPEKTDFKVSAVGNQVTLSTAKMTVLVDVLTGGIQFLTVNGKQLFMEKPYGIQFAPCMDGTKASYQVRQAFLLDSDETIYGLGEHENGVMNQRNQTLELKNENMSVCIPMIQSIKGYGVFWDQYAISTFRDNRQELSMESVGACADYYFMYGGNADGVIADMRALTGQSPMLPLWAYGFFQSRERYKNQTEPVAVVAKYRELGVPLDCIIQDWQYWGKDSLWNAMDFNPETYPDPKGMVDKVHKMHAKMMIVAWPGFGPLTPQYKELKDRDMLINFDTWPPKSGTKPYDVYNPAARDIYWNYLSKGVFSKGFDAWWLDSSEPDHINVKEADFDQVTHLGTFRSVHNAFPLMTTGGVYDHWRAERSDKRVV